MRDVKNGKIVKRGEKVEKRKRKRPSLYRYMAISTVHLVERQINWRNL